ncbi:MAG: hypothetical protein KDK06_07905 [Gammaproteobacteria bacterium]|nr:hypothetical protein [Gammaproteobacteria bacterium]
MIAHWRRLGLCFAITLVVALVARMPATWAIWGVRAWLPPDFHYAAVEGTVLGARFSGVRVDTAGALPVGTLELAPDWSRLVRGRLALAWRAVGADGVVEGSACRHGARWTLAAVQGRLDADVLATLVPSLPPLRGALVLAGPSLDCSGAGILAIDAAGLALDGGPRLGDYAVELARSDDGAWQGTLVSRDAAALVIDAHLGRAPGQPGIELTGTVHAGAALPAAARAWFALGADAAPQPFSWRIPL